MSLRTRVEQRVLRQEIYDGILEVQGYYFDPEDLDRELFEDEFGPNLDRPSIFTGKMYDELEYDDEDIEYSMIPITEDYGEIAERQEVLLDFGIYQEY